MGEGKGRIKGGDKWIGRLASRLMAVGPLQCGQDARKPEAGGHDGLPDAPDHGRDRRHLKVGGSVYKGNDGTVDDATGRRRQDAHHEDEDGKEAPELVLAQRHERDDRRARVHEDGREEGPQKDVVPHLDERAQRRRTDTLQTDHIRYRVQLRDTTATAVLAIVHHRWCAFRSGR